ncbi:uncharacterized protein LOC130709994 [Lotus japonicus]|uniref:uncharacterized protein LOC130709994 n=1 Tax=Lotus japonicus TaxID=34305 RepID=UPI002587625E|nr:uncharacterized protein LOC130709994 [Lotus japonicus]
MERRYVCRYCFKRFPCGKSLGGHIRTHMTQERNDHNNDNAAAADSDMLKLDIGEIRMKQQNKKRDLSWSQTGSSSTTIYGLRENPKKTMRFLHPDHHVATTTLEQDEKFCKECGKGFPSLKALCGHMASHSDKHKSEEEIEKLVLVDSQSDTTETCNSTPQRRSKRMKRFKSLNPSSSVVDCSSPVSEVEQEQEEVAMCLMLLSRDSSHRFHFVSESSDNNSVVLEHRSFSPYGNNFVSNQLKEKKLLINDVKLKSFDNSDSRYYRYGSKTKMADYDDVSNDELKWSKVGEKSGFDEEHDFELNRGRSKYATLYKKLMLEDLEYDRSDETSRKFDSRKRAQNFVGNSIKKTANGFTNDEEIYEFLDGERDSDLYSTNESDENSSESDSFTAPRSQNGKKTNNTKKKKLKTKKSKEHECPICYRIFKSGQALGGHKRSHFIGGNNSQENNNTLVIKQGAVPCLIDLNLPAPDDD